MHNYLDEEFTSDAMRIRARFLNMNGGERRNGDNNFEFTKVDDFNYVLYAQSAFEGVKECFIEMQMSQEFQKVGFNSLVLECEAGEQCYFVQD